MWRMIVLGSAQDGGLPQIGGTHRNDLAARTGHIPSRMASSVAVAHDDGRVLLLDAGPDLRLQLELLATVHDRTGRPGPVDGVVLTHGHMGHYAGLVHFGREAMAADRLPVWATPRMCEFLESSRPWSLTIDQGHVDPRRIEPEASFEPWPDLTIRLVPVPHRQEVSDAVAVSVSDVGLYLPDIDSWDQWDTAEEEIATHRVAFLDATFHHRDEVPGRDLSSIPHPLVTDTLERFGHLNEDRDLVLTHLNHTNPLCDPGSAEAATARAAGFHIAIEGDSFPI